MSIADTELPDTVIRLAAKLLRVAKKEGSFDPYIHCLPQPFPNPKNVYARLPHRSICQESLNKIVQYSPIQLMAGPYVAAVEVLRRNGVLSAASDQTARGFGGRYPMGFGCHSVTVFW